MNDKISISAELKSQAIAGAKASELARWLIDRLGKRFSVFDFDRYFKEVFSIPLGTLRYAEAWVGFSEDGLLSDDDFNRLLDPWINLE